MYHSPLGLRVSRRRRRTSVAGFGVEGGECRVQGSRFGVKGLVQGVGFGGSGVLPPLLLLFFFFTLVTGPGRSLSLKLSDRRVYEPYIRFL